MNRLAISLTLAGALGAGCKKTVKTAEVEGWMKQRTTALGINASKVTCPKNIEPKQGTSFDCEIEVEGKTYTITGTVTKVDKEQAHFDTAWKNGPNGVIIRSKLVPALEEEMGKNLGAKVMVTCGEPLLFLDAKRSTTCELAAGATKSNVTLTFDDKLVPTDWKLDPPLLGKTKLEEILTPSVREKTAPDVGVRCGGEALIARPADGVVMCEIANADASKTGKIKVEIDPDLKVKRWEVVP